MLREDCISNVNAELYEHRGNVKDTPVLLKWIVWVGRVGLEEWGLM